ncbi:aldo/keto reductase [Methylobacterium isbiliense]|jgi:D-threo-aldose 1-dehydrogenase|uniref:Pyridoxal 4-dehydrogenase n=1 Tax=Methylobacterium isbiliense TaxID=315478 RepID=A0ABQ4SGC6_9HYPH|nr:aldo/keto reductase [Methylobacterium isbiliense]MDN3624484.1 aldo/keto reductase [Methylobacterium isbiliense]GJE02162.1 Pyridoxal 4-dehydrogenase [Methylobacterium isbiliense]
MARFSPPGPLGFGGAPLGNMFDVVDEETAAAALSAAWETGVRYFDTAPHYGSGLSEHRFGGVLRRAPRDAFVLSTKVGRLLRPDRTRPENPPFVEGLPFRVEPDYSYDATMRSIEDSCQRLGLAQIDIAFVHDLAADHLGDAWEEQFEVARAGAFRALTALREQGVIRGWGLGVNLTEPCIRALERADPDVFLLAGRYSLLNQPALERLFPMCGARGVHVVVGGPYNSGLLAGGRTFEYQEAPPDMIAKRDRIAAVCERHGADMRSAALQFCAAHPVVAAIIPGAKRAEKVRENARLMAATVPSAVWDELRQAQLIPADAPTPG